jgi:RNA polymerase sigma factor (sigma-70 family)
VRVLVTNDDGIDSAGLHALARSMVARGHDVVVAASLDDRTGSGGAIGPAAVGEGVDLEERVVPGLDGVPAHKRKHLKHIQATVGAMEQRLQRAPAEEEIAAELGITLQAYQETLLELRAVSLGSLDATPQREDSRSLIHFIATPEENSPARLLERSELEKVIAEGVKKMPRVEGLVLDLYYRQELGIREIAPILNLHITRVSQIKAQAILRLRNYLQRHWPTPKGTY